MEYKSHLNPNAFIILQSIDGIGPVFAGGIVAEIGDIAAFSSSDALSLYASDYFEHKKETLSQSPRKASHLLTQLNDM